VEDFFQDFLTYVLYAKLAVMAIYLIHIIRGPSIWDRLMGLNLVATKTVMALILFASMQEIPFLLDLAILFALFGFMGTLFLCVFLSKHRLGKVRGEKKPQSKVDNTEGSDA